MRNKRIAHATEVWNLQKAWFEIERLREGERVFSVFSVHIVHGRMKLLIRFIAATVILLSRFKWNRKSDRCPNFACLVTFAEQKSEFVLGFYREIFQ